MFSNGNSFGNGQSLEIGSPVRSTEMWIFRLMQPLQDRGDV